MTTKQERSLKMYLAVREFLIENEELTKNIPHFEVHFTAFGNIIDQILATGEKQRICRTGIAREKKQLRQNLMKIAVDNSSKLSAFAKITDNMNLYYEVNFSVSDFEDMKDVAFKDYVQIIYNKAEANISSLERYMITPETQKIFREAIAAFNVSMAKPRLGITERSQATRQLAVLLRNAYSIIQDIDASAGVIAYKHPDFFNGYKSIRKLAYTRAGILALRATVTELPGGHPVRGAVFTFRPDGAKSGSNGNGVITKKSAKKGSFNIKNMPAGTYQVVIKKPGYKEKEVIVFVADGERRELKVELEKV